MSASIRNSASLILLTIFLTICSGCDSTPSPQPENHYAPSVIQLPSAEILLSGDIAFRLGRTLQSEAIAAGADQGMRYSHIGIVIKEGEQISIVHIEPEREGAERVKCESLEVFFATENAVSGAIVRVDSLSDNQRAIITKHAIDAVNSPIRFDHDYSLSDTTRMYCTELTEWVFSKADIELSQGKRHHLPLTAEAVILPRDILSRNDLTLVWEFSN